MPRPRDPRRDEAKTIWLTSNGDMKLVDLANQMKVTPSTIRKWKAQDKWDNELKGSAPKCKRGHPGGQRGNQNAKGHGPPKRNTNALKFGFFSKYLPEESLDIMNEIQDRPPEDMLWDQIMIQYTAIIRAQKIMLVDSRDDMTKEENFYMHSESSRQTKTTDSSSETEQHGYLIQFAWDKQANFLNAQSRAMSELRALIKQFVAIADEQDIRWAKLEQMQASIMKLKAETAKLKGDDQDDYEDDGFLDALNGKTADVWMDYNENVGDYDADS